MGAMPANVFKQPRGDLYRLQHYIFRNPPGLRVGLALPFINT
jgi:hypothetical protein